MEYNCFVTILKKIENQSSNHPTIHLCAGAALNLLAQEELKESKTLPKDQLINVQNGIKVLLTVASINPATMSKNLKTFIKSEMERREKELPLKEKPMAQALKAIDQGPSSQCLAAVKKCLLNVKKEEKAFYDEYEMKPPKPPASPFNNLWHSLKESKDEGFGAKLLIHFCELINAIEKNDIQNAIAITLACAQMSKANKQSGIEVQFLKLLNLERNSNLLENVTKSIPEILQHVRNFQPEILEQFFYNAKEFMNYMDNNKDYLDANKIGFDRKLFNEVQESLPKLAKTTNRDF